MLTNNLKYLEKALDKLPATPRMPVIFTSHGNPLDITLPANTNAFQNYLSNIGLELIKKYEIKAVMIISAHWCTNGSYVNITENPETIFDYYGFPKEYYSDSLKYHAPGHPIIAGIVAEVVPQIKATEDWGFDHGNWPIMKHIFPNGNVPIFQLSIDYHQSPQYHYELAKLLKAFRDKGVLIIGSGAIVHNLRAATPRMFSGDNRLYGWDEEFDTYIKDMVNQRNINAIINYENHKLGLMAAPTPDHYVPLIYAMAMINNKDEIKHTYEGLYPAFSERSFIAESIINK